MYFGCFGLEFGSISTRYCGLVLQVGLIMTDKSHYQTFSDFKVFKSLYPTQTGSNTVMVETDKN